MEVAVQSRFSEQEGAPSVYQEQRREERAPAVDANPVDMRYYHVQRHRGIHGIWGWGTSIVAFPFRFFYSTFMDIFRFVYRLLRPDPRRYVTDPIGDVTSFIQRFEEEYGFTHPTFIRDTYSQALNTAKKDLQFLLVYLHGDDHQDTRHFCRSTLCNEAVVAFIEAHSLFWACNTASPEGYRVSQALRENTYPYLALIVLRDNRMTVVSKIEGDIGGDELIARLTRVIDENESSLISERAEREERSFNQTLRAEQDVAYEESLRADQEKARKKREEQEAIERAEQEEIDRTLEETRRLEEIVQRKIRLRNEIPEEPMADDSDSIRILLKLPSGIRLERRFLKTHSIQNLYNYIFVHEAAPDDFKVVANYPRREIPCQPADTEPAGEQATFESIGLGKSEMLFVTDNEA